MAAIELRTFEDIYNAVAEELKIQTSDTVSMNRIKRDINMGYLDEVMPFHNWYWAKKKVDRVAKKHINSGSVTVTNESTSVTLSAAPSVSYKGKLFVTDAFAEVYTIKAHAANSTAITLESPYQGNSASGISYKIYEDGIPLPVDADEVFEVYHDHNPSPLYATSNLQFTEIMLMSPRREGRPAYYTVEEYSDPVTYSTISGLPALSTRASEGNVRTLVFASTVAAYLEEGSRVMIQLSGNNSYNCEAVLEDVSTTTIKYVHPDSLSESATADLTLQILLQDQPEDNEVFRKLRVYPFLSTENTTLHIESILKVKPLEDAADEPIIPLRDRIVLLYFALEKAWRRHRNTEEAQLNGMKFERKLAKMAGKMQNGMDNPVMTIARTYKASKRLSRSSRRRWSEF